jgi:hypothetical protein
MYHAKAEIGEDTLELCMGVCCRPGQVAFQTSIYSPSGIERRVSCTRVSTPGKFCNRDPSYSRKKGTEAWYLNSRG